MMGSRRFGTRLELMAVIAAGVLAALPSRAMASKGPGATEAERASTPASSQVRAGAQGGSAAVALLSGRGLTLDQPAVRIYRSVGRDGSVTFSDHPEPGAQAMQIRTFASSSDRQALETAKQQRRHWREQAEAFARRQQEREAMEEQAQRDRERASSGVVIVVMQPSPVWWGSAGARPLVDPSLVSPSYRSTPGAASRAPAEFIGSGFSTSTR